MAKQMVATETFQANVNGFSEKFTAGQTIVDEDHPTVKVYPERFKPIKEEKRERPEIEEATATPGVKRGEKR